MLKDFSMNHLVHLHRLIANAAVRLASSNTS